MRDDIRDALRRTVEQMMSDERLLGALPEDAAQSLLDRTIARLDAAAEHAADVDSFTAAADGIRAEARAAADAESIATEALTTDQPNAGALSSGVGVVREESGHPAGEAQVVAAPDARPAAAESPETRPAWSEELQAALDEAVGRLRSLFGRRGGEG